MINVEQVRGTLKTVAFEQVSRYPQYRGHSDNYFLVRAKRNVRSKLGPSFVKNELAIARPVIYTRDDGVKKYKTIVVWSNISECDTHVNVKDIEMLEL